MTDRTLDENKLIGLSALLIHAAKLDENYTKEEEEIIKKFLNSFTNDDAIILQIMKKGKELESKSNHLLDFTNIIKKNSLESKSIVIKELWKIILSDNKSDNYESNFIRRICGLIYFPDKLSGEIKLKILNDKKLI
jgi:uncharacterized tellurite resistance protein B-like protein|tara:strand:+ start:503 stop:910 length:408 start_codon:yes stop_codon:yes gene_type:complete